MLWQRLEQAQYQFDVPAASAEVACTLFAATCGFFYAIDAYFKICDMLTPPHFDGWTNSSRDIVVSSLLQSGVSVKINMPVALSPEVRF